jgi:hypothetical protein
MALLWNAVNVAACQQIPRRTLTIAGGNIMDKFIKHDFNEILNYQQMNELRDRLSQAAKAYLNSQCVHVTTITEETDSGSFEVSYEVEE